MANILETGRKSKDAIKSEHLREGVRPILACVGIPEQFKKNMIKGEKFSDFCSNKLSAVHNVDYYEKPKKLRKKGFESGHRKSYVISAVDGRDKFSRTYRDCTGIVVAGIDKETGNNISFMTHQDPGRFLVDKCFYKGRVRFLKDLAKKLGEMKEKCKEGSLDAIIFGGNYFLTERESMNNYLRSIRLLSERITEVLGFKPAVATGPKVDDEIELEKDEDNVFYDNDKRRLHIERPSVGDSTAESFSPSSLLKKEESWFSKDMVKRRRLIKEIESSDLDE